MTITVTSDLVDITNADTTTTGGTFYRLGGQSSSNPAADNDAMIQGAGCVAYKCSTTVTPTDTGGHFNATATFNMTGKHLFAWILAVTAGNMNAKSADGIDIGLTNTSTTSSSAWSTTNYKRWRVDGSDIQPASVGWKCYVIDPSSAADLSAGTLALSTLKNVGILVRQATSVSTTLNNVFNDALRMGTGVTLVCGAGTDVASFADIYNTDKLKANAWGILTAVSGIYYGAAKISIGSTSQTNICTFTDSNQVLIWRDYPVSATLYEFNLNGAAAYRTTMTLSSSVVRGQGAAVWNITCDANSDFKAYDSALSGIRSATLSAGSVLSGTSIASSKSITTNGATVTGCAFSAGTGTQLVINSSTEMSSVSNNTFTSAGTGHAIQITAAGNYSFSNLTFTGYAGANGSTGNEAVYVSATTGTVNITVSGGNTPSIRTAGATVNVQSGATVTFTGLPVGADIVILTAGTSTILQQVDQNSTSSYAWSYSGTPTVDVGFIKPGYRPFYFRNLSLGSVNASVPVSLQTDPVYS